MLADPIAGTILHVALIPTDDMSRVYVDANGRLPSFSLPANEASPRRNVAQASRTFASLLGMPVTIRRPLWVDNPSAVRVYVLEPLGKLPDRWVPLEGTRLPGWQHRTEELVAALRGEDGSPPWYAPGYRERVESWLVDVLTEREGPCAPRIHQLRHWTLSAVWAVETSNGRYFFKNGSLGNREAAKTAVVAALWPEIAPVIVASQPDHDWLLTADTGGTQLSKVWSPELWMRTAFEYGRLQVESTALRTQLGDELSEIRPMSAYVDDASELLRDNVLTSDTFRLLPAELAGFRATVERRLRAIEMLSRHDNLLALDHGDFDAHQVMVVDQSIKILDWGGVGLSHPLIGIENFLRTLHEGGRLRGKQKTKLRRVAYGAMRRVARSLGRPVGDPTGRYHRQIRESFLAAWSDHAMRGKIVRDFPLIEEAFPLLMTVEWWRTKNQLANPWEAEANLIQYIRQQLP